MNRLLIISMLLSFSFLANSCSREYSEADEEREYYFKRIAIEEFDALTFIEVLDNGHYFMGANSADSQVVTLSIFETDPQGHILKRQDLIQNDRSFIVGHRLADGTLYVGGDLLSYVSIYDGNGSLIKEGQFLQNLTSNYLHQKAIVDENGRYWLGITNGLYTGVTNENFIVGMNKDLVYDQGFRIDSSDMGGKILFLNVDRVEDGELWVSGTMFPNPWSWTSSAKVFAGVLSTDTIQHQAPAINILDLNDDSHDPIIIDYVHTPDGGLIQLVTDHWDNQSFSYSNQFRLISWDKSRLIKWDKTFEWNSGIRPVGMCLGADGDVLITGSVFWTKDAEEFPFFMRVNEQGQEKTRKIFLQYNNSAAEAIAEDVNGDLLFVGFSLNFLKGAEGSDGFLMKTDRNGDQ